MTYSLRGAVSADEIEIRDLIARSIRALGTGDYSSEQIEAALTGGPGGNQGFAMAVSALGAGLDARDPR